MGRKKLGADKKSEKMTFKVTPKEKAAIENAALKHKCNVSTMIRYKVIDIAIGEVPHMQVLAEEMFQLRCLVEDELISNKTKEMVNDKCLYCVLHKEKFKTSLH